MSVIESFQDALTSAYLERPCNVLPNALWKTLENIESFETGFGLRANKVEWLMAQDSESFMVYWNREGVFEVPESELKEKRLILAHDSYLDRVRPDKYPDKRAYFRMHLREEVNFDIHPDFRLEAAGPGQAAEISDFIGRCYDHMHPDAKEVDGWAKRRVFDENLWIWAIVKETGLPAGLIIAEHDRTIEEISLEWVQVLPGYRGLNLGAALVSAIIQRSAGADIITVSGEIDSGVSEFYRRCGFSGDDVWWVLRK